MEQLYESLGISRPVLDFAGKILDSLEERFREIDDMAEYNQLKVIRAMQEARVSAECFQATSGYGYNDLGRETLERVYALTFHTEDALVRPQITCGTHALALALSSNLRPGDELLSISGKPYDTLEEVIGIRPSCGSLSEYGITYAQTELKEDGSFGSALTPASIGLTDVRFAHDFMGYDGQPHIYARNGADAGMYCYMLSDNSVENYFSVMVMDYTADDPAQQAQADERMAAEQMRLNALGVGG